MFIRAHVRMSRLDVPAGVLACFRHSTQFAAFVGLPLVHSE